MTMTSLSLVFKHSASAFVLHVNDKPKGLRCVGRDYITTATRKLYLTCIYER